jgi:hypothetical protein
MTRSFRWVTDTFVGHDRVVESAKSNVWIRSLAVDQAGQFRDCGLRFRHRNIAHMGKFEEVDRNSFLVEPGNELTSVHE